MTPNQIAIKEQAGPALAGALRLTAFLLLVGIMAPVQAAFLWWKPRDPYALPLFFHRLLVAVLGFRVRAHGAMASGVPVLYASNHASYLDIPVLGSLIPASFVAKSEVARWPLFGLMAKLQRTVFIERRAVLSHEHRNELQARLESGQSVILFPEGTSSEGLTALPFKSSMFAAVENAGPQSKILVQPVSITCTEIDGLPLTRALRPAYAWFGDMTLLPHLWNVFRMGRFTVDVVFHPAVRPDSFAGRKRLSHYCHQRVAHGIELSLTGRGNALAKHDN